MVAGGGTSPGGGRRSMQPKGSAQGGKNKGSAADSSPNVISVSGHRLPETDDPLLMSIATKQGALVQPLITLTCYIPTSSVGAVIGRRGAVIGQIQQKAQQVGTSNGPVRLSIVGHQSELASAQTGESPGMSMEHQQQQQQQQQQQHQQLQQSSSPTSQLLMSPLQSSASSVPYTYSELDFSSESWTPVVIRSDPVSTLTAAQLLLGKVGHMDDVVMDVPLGRAKHAAVVGRRGYVLANLSADTNVRIMVPRRELRHDIVQLEGELSNVIQCLERVLSISSPKKADDSASGGKQKNKGAAATSNNTPSSTNNGNNNNNNNNSGSRQQQEKSEESAAAVANESAPNSQAKGRSTGRKTKKSKPKHKKKKGAK